MNETPTTLEQTHTETGKLHGASVEHIKRMIDYAKEKEDYALAPDELRDAWTNDCDAGSGEGEE